MDEKKLAQEVAKNLLKIKAVFLKPNDPLLGHQALNLQSIAIIDYPYLTLR